VHQAQVISGGRGREEIPLPGFTFATGHERGNEQAREGETACMHDLAGAWCASS
jgi:hypothetical protein